MKKLIAILCAVMLVLTCSISVFAAGDGTITVEGAVAGQQYSIYKILDLSYAAGETSADTGAYSYTVTSAWAKFFDSTENTTHTAVFDYINIDNDGVVSWEGENSDTRAGEFAKLALSWAKANNIAATDTVKATIPDGESEATASFTGLDYGYYLLDSSLGALCSLTTTTPSATVKEKNPVPTVDKVIVEGTQEVEENTASIGDTVNFKSTITANEGLEALTWYDTMSAGLTYNNDIVIKIGDTVLTEGAEADYNTVEDGKHTITVEFTKNFLGKLTESTEIVITYSALLDADAEIGDEGNTNTVYITYGNGPGSTPVTTTTYTYSFDLVKTNSANKLLAGAGFKLYATKEENEYKNVILLVKIDENTYRVAVTGENTVEEIVTNDTGKIVIKGLDADVTYYLVETTTPAGYNPITSAEEVTIDSTKGNLNATMKDSDVTIWETGGVHIINNSGNILPETGGMGTTLFIAIGAIVVLVTGVILVARKRMSKYVA